MQKKKIAITALILLAVLLLFPPSVLSECPKSEYSINELRSDIRKIVFGFLSNPSGVYTKNEILDLLAFYKDQKGKAMVDNCDVKASLSLSGEQISAILAKTIVYQKECSDGFDNDGDGKIDYLSDSGCTGLNDNDETNCGDNVCEGTESCFSCKPDCGNCMLPGIGTLLMKRDIENAINFRDTGDVFLKGTLTKKNPSPVITSDDEFIVKNAAGNTVVVINLVTGNMAIKGDLREKQAALAPSASGNNIIVKDSRGNVISYIDDSGNFYLKGALTQNANT